MNRPARMADEKDGRFIFVHVRPAAEPRTPDDEQLLEQLANLWKTFIKHDFQVRREVGALLNEKLGPPDKRLPHGTQTLKKAASRLEVAESDLSRFRWFAHRFSSVEDFQKQHPRVTS